MCLVDETKRTLGDFFINCFHALHVQRAGILDLAISEMIVGETRLFIGALRDIGSRKQAEDALAESDVRMRLLLESTGEAVYGVDRLLERWNALDDADRARFCFDPAVIDWGHYVREVHLPSVVEHARVRTSAGGRSGPNPAVAEDTEEYTAPSSFPRFV